MNTPDYITIRAWLNGLRSAIRHEIWDMDEEEGDYYNDKLGRYKSELEEREAIIDEFLLGLAMDYARAGGSQSDVDEYWRSAEWDEREYLLEMETHWCRLADADPNDEMVWNTAHSAKEHS